MKKGELEFKTSVAMLISSSIRLFNEDKINNFLPKTKVTKIYSDISSATKLLLGLTKKKILQMRGRFRAWSKKFNSWQKYLVRFYLAMALHYILDSYYHIFKKFGVDSKRLCNWCGVDINSSWSKVMSGVILDAVPNSYVYASLGFDANSSKKDTINKAFIEAKTVYTGLLYD